MDFSQPRDSHERSIVLVDQHPLREAAGQEAQELLREVDRLHAVLNEFDRTIQPNYERWESENLAPLLEEEFLMDDDEKSFTELAGEPDGHECLTVSAGYTDESIVVAGLEGIYDGQLFGTQSLVEHEFGAQISAGGAGVAIGFTAVLQAPEAGQIPPTLALIVYGKRIDTGTELGCNLRLYSQSPTHTGRGRQRE